MKGLWQRFYLFTHSLRFRLVVWFAMILSAVLVAFSGFVYLSQRRDVRGETAFHLEQRLEYVLHSAQVIDGEIILPDGMLQENDVLVFLKADGDIIASLGKTPADQIVRIVSRLTRLPHDPDSAPVVYGETDSDLNYAFVTGAARDITGNPYVAILGTPVDTYGLINRLTLTLLLGSGLTMAIALGGGLWLADRAMRPVKTITQTARTIGETDLSRRINIKNKDEIGELANTFDAMLARLETAFQRQRQFVADASHELRTPLTIVNLETSRALAAKRSPQEYQRAIGVIQSENEFMARLVNDLLILARMDSGQTTLEKTTLDLSDVALEAVERLETLAARNHIRLEVGDLPEAPLHGNRQLLLQMVSNLIENGIKYAGETDKFVRVETEVSAEKVWLRVADNGRGIPVEHVPHLFERFYRADKARTRDETEDAFGGTGLGLSIVQSIVEAHGGEINVKSAENEGTTFEISFERSHT